MTGDTAPSPFVVSSSGLGRYTESDPFHSLDGDLGTGFSTGEYFGGGPAWVQIDLGAGIAVTLASFSLAGGMGLAYGDGGTGANPRDFTLSGSNDNFTTSTVIATQTGITWDTLSQTQNFPVTGSGTYRYFRVTVTAINGGSDCVIGEIYLFAAGFAGGQAGDFYYDNAGKSWYGPRPSGSTPTWPQIGTQLNGEVQISSDNNTTGSTTAALGSNSPATTGTAPYTWVKLYASDGSVVYVPAWK
jgi:hypothetical protein